MTTTTSAPQKRVLDLLLDDIDRGILRPNEKLNEDMLAKRYGVSRTPLRAAIRQLAAEGVIETTPHKGARIAPITTTIVHDSFEMRKILDIHAIRMACQHISDYELQNLDQDLNDMETAHHAGNFSENYTRLRDYHLALLRHLRNRHMERAARRLLQRFALLRFLLVHTSGMSRLLPCLREVLNCVNKRDPDAAEKAMEYFLTVYMEIVFEEVMATHPIFEQNAATK